MSRTRVALAILGGVCAVAVGLALVSGGSDVDPRTPPALPGMPPPFLGTAVVGDGGATAAVDAYGDVVELRAPGPAGRALIDNPAARQAAGTVPARTGFVPLVRIGGAGLLPVWRAEAVSQRYLAGSDVVRTSARFAGATATIESAARGTTLVVSMRTRSHGSAYVWPAISVRAAGRVRCDESGGPGRLELVCSTTGSEPRTAAEALLRAATTESRDWLAAALPLGRGAPAWARRMYGRSLLVLRSLTDRRTGAVAAGARDGWAYVWPRDAATAALAFAAAGYRSDARRVAGFLDGLGLGAAARFEGDGNPVPGRGPQGDASGWVTAAATVAGLPSPRPLPWRHRPDYQEGGPGDYLANFLAAHGDVSELRRPYSPPSSDTSSGSGGSAAAFETPRGLVREAESPASGLDSAAAWAVRPFPWPSLYAAARRTLLALAAGGTRYGITPGEGWDGGEDPWSAPTAWSAWSLAALAQRGGAAGRRDRRAALGLLADLRRAATPAGTLPERVGARTGIPTSTTPLAWTHAFAILALRELWPTGRKTPYR